MRSKIISRCTLSEILLILQVKCRTSHHQCLPSPLPLLKPGWEGESPYIGSGAATPACVCFVCLEKCENPRRRPALIASFAGEVAAVSVPVSFFCLQRILARGQWHRQKAQPGGRHVGRLAFAALGSWGSWRRGLRSKKSPFVCSWPLPHWGLQGGGGNRGGIAPLASQLGLLIWTGNSLGLPRPLRAEVRRPGPSKGWGGVAGASLLLLTPSFPLPGGQRTPVEAQPPPLSTSSSLCGQGQRWEEEAG